MRGMLDLQTIVSRSFVLMSARPKPSSKRRPRFDLNLNLREYMRVSGVLLYGAVGGCDNVVFGR